MHKPAVTSVPIHEPLARRWSPVGYDPRPMSDEEVSAVLEAARWAASGFNKQPWRFLAARRQDGPAFAALLDCLVDANRDWAQHASLLLLALAERLDARGNPNPKAPLELGLALGNLTAEAAARGLWVHAMGGILPDEARARFRIPDDVEVWVALAVGHQADDAAKADAHRERDAAPRTRLPLSELVFQGTYGEPAPWLEDNA
ncbi:MAG TPA: nitroreductase family protein [Candidatus Krumholzibacteria bacterium]|nr:nitroreductase family protein [Candidatus Krumholzibacteria bacterium]